MFPPPPGFEDMLADAEARPCSSPFVVRAVPELGKLRLRRPMPDAVAVLAMASNPDSKEQERLNSFMRFAQDHTDEGDLDRVLRDMMMGDLPADAVERIARELVMWGTSRPYTAVVSLAVMTAYHWRTIRQKLVMAGIADPMSLSSMHAVLDIAEAIAVESATNAENPSEELAGLYRRLYGPSADNSIVPVGFSPDEVEDSFDAFARAAR